MLPAHAAVVHAVLVDGLEAGVQEAVGHFLHAAEDLGGNLVFVIARLEAHDADVFGAEALHAGDGAFDLGERDVEGVADLLGPVHDGGAEAIDADAGGLQLADGEVEGGVRDVVEIGLGEAGDFDAPGFEVFPAQFLRGQDLAVNAVGGFVADAH